MLVLEGGGELEYRASFISQEQPLLTGGHISKITEKPMNDEMTSKKLLLHQLSKEM